jgi:four helix bundle protein
MAAGERGFEGLKVWQSSRQLCQEVHPIVMAAQRCHDYPLSQQLSAAALSIVANIAEGYLRRTRREFVPFVRIAAGSNGEVRACLYVAADRGYVAPGTVTALLERSNEIGRMLQGLLTALQRPDAGPPQP